MKGMQDYLFGKKGVLNDGDLSTGDLQGIMGYLAKIKQSSKDTTGWLDEINSAYEKIYGESLKTSSTSTANAVSGATEQEVNIVAAYMDSIRQYTYNNSMNLQKIIDNGIKIQSSPIFTEQLKQLEAIAANTFRNADMAEKLYNLIYDNTLGNNKIHVA